MSVPTVPVGYSGQSAIAMVRLRANEPSYPSDLNILTFLNAAIEQVSMRVGGIHLFQSYPTQQFQNMVTLGNDVQDIISASWSSGDPTQNSTVYPLEQLEPIGFMNFAAGYPAVGAGPPTSFMLVSDFGTGPNGSLPPPQTPNVGVIGGTSAGYPSGIFVVTTVVNPAGESLPSPESNDIILTTTQQAQVTSPPLIGNAESYNVYATTNDDVGPYYLQGSSPIGTPFVIPGTLITGSAQPPITGTATFPSGGFMVMQLYPPAMLGQVNLYYRGRPLQWADTTANSFTNLDTMAQEAAIIWATQRVLEHRGRGDEAKDLFQPQFEDTLAEIKEKIQKRTAPKSGRVRDVHTLPYGSNMPFWYR